MDIKKEHLFLDLVSRRNWGSEKNNASKKRSKNNHDWWKIRDYHEKSRFWLPVLKTRRKGHNDPLSW